MSGLERDRADNLAYQWPSAGRDLDDATLNEKASESVRCSNLESGIHLPFSSLAKEY